VSAATGCYRSAALATRARVDIVLGAFEEAERDAYEALALAVAVGSHLVVPDTLDCLAEIASEAESYREAARLLGAAEANRQRMGWVRFKVADADHDTFLSAIRNAMGDEDFDAAFAEGAALSTDEAIAYAQRGRGERKRPSSGWASLTPTELDVVRLLGDGLANKEIATRLFISPRTVESHLSRVYSKLGISSRVHLAQEAGRHP
jgi:DNA-binding NarL/FixJ family response regulator